MNEGIAETLTFPDDLDLKACGFNIGSREKDEANG